MRALPRVWRCGGQHDVACAACELLAWAAGWPDRAHAAADAITAIRAVVLGLPYVPATVAGWLAHGVASHP